MPEGAERSVNEAAFFLISRLAAPPLLAHEDALPDTTSERLRVFSDCQTLRCDERFIRTEVDFVDWVRDREDAQVHVIVMSQRSGGGIEFVVDLVGRAPPLWLSSQAAPRRIPLGGGPAPSLPARGEYAAGASHRGRVRGEVPRRWRSGDRSVPVGGRKLLAVAGGAAVMRSGH